MLKTLLAGCACLAPLAFTAAARAQTAPPPLGSAGTPPVTAARAPAAMMTYASASPPVPGAGAGRAQAGVMPVATAPGAAGPATGVQEVIVTARRRNENVQTVPIAVTALSSADLKARRLDSASNLELTVPNLNFSQGGYGSSNFQIRGIGFQIVSTAADAGVSEGWAQRK